MRKIILSTIAMLLLSSVGYGADWKLIGTSWETDYYYDPQSEQVLSKDIVQVWIKKIYGEKKVKEFIKGIGPEFKELSYDNSLIEFNCSEKKISTFNFQLLQKGWWPYNFIYTRFFFLEFYCSGLYS